MPQVAHKIADMPYPIYFNDLKEKRIIITGGAYEIGAACTRLFIRAGAKVVIFDMKDELAGTLVNELVCDGHERAHYLHVDVTKKGEVLTAVERAVALLGGLDSLVHAAEIEDMTLAEDISEEQLDKLLNVNVNGTVFTNQAVFPYLKEKGGSIVNFGSRAAVSPHEGSAHYAATKGAVHSWTRTVASEWKTFKIRVNSIVPASWSEMQAEQRQKRDQAVELGHPLEDNFEDLIRDMVAPVAFLVSDASRFVSGQVLSADSKMEQVE